MIKKVIAVSISHHERTPHMLLADIEAAQATINPYIRHTPLEEVNFPGLSSEERKIHLKWDSEQTTGSFKLRGALNFMLNLSAEAKAKGVITRSSGNFGQALAYAGKLLGVQVTVVMAENASRLKASLIQSHGGTVIFHGLTSKVSDAFVDEKATQEGLTKAHPYDHPHVIAGQGTAALEIFADNPSLTTYFCPVSGGGLMSGTAAALKQRNPKIRVIAVEPAGANDCFLSFQAGRRVEIEAPNTIADGLRVTHVGDHTWPLLQRYVDEVVTVTDDQIRDAMQKIFAQTGKKVEPSGAVSVAGLLAYPQAKLGNTIACMISGGNIASEDFDQIVAALGNSTPLAI
ncbi:MAG: threonine/serine dehydratase [Candidatus Margulisiibacteriota bacterium]